MPQPPRWGLETTRVLLADDVFLIAVKNTFVFAVVTGAFELPGQLRVCLVDQRVEAKN